MKKLGLNPAFKIEKTLSSYFSSPKDKIDPFQKSGVSQNWKIAKSEINNKTENFYFAIHLNEKNHKFIEDSRVKLIHHVENSLKLNIYEALEIIKSFKSNPDFCLNDQINISNSPILNLFPSITEKKNYSPALLGKP